MTDLRAGLLRAFERLVKEDGYLFDCPIEEHSEYDARKLHEVCINHRLANYLEAELFFQEDDEKMFFDIEFNREGGNSKELQVNGKDGKVRPDIIIHNRKTGKRKINFLVVECKKKGATQKEIREDYEKICAFMDDKKYRYSFGLQVFYGKDCVEAILFSRNGVNIEPEKIEYNAGKAHSVGRQ